MRFINLIVALYVTGCGVAPEQEPGTQAPAVGLKPADGEAVKPVPQVTAAPAEAAQDTPDAQKVSASPAAAPRPLISLAVAEMKALPICDAYSEGELAYTKAEKAFYVCGEGSWAEIDVRGEKGDQGAAGAQGVAGVDGKVVTIPPTILDPNEWLEVNSGKVWTKTTLATTFTTAKIACERPGYRFPTEDELKVAVVTGSLKTPIGYLWVWAGTGRAADPNAEEIMVGMEPTDKGLAYCVKTGGTP